jgi:hypothetical protein
VIRLFCGYDARESHGFHVFAHSVIKRASQPASIVPLTSCGLPVGSNAFTLSRFLVPSLCDYKGWAIFADASDMLMLGDVARLNALHDDAYAVQVVKHPVYRSEHERKYIGTAMECEQTNYERKNWASLMLFNCAHPAWRGIDADYLSTAEKLEVLQFRFLPNEDIGELPANWNVLVDEGQDDSAAGLLHWTAGIPAFAHYQNARRSLDWFREFREMCGMQPAAAPHG